MKYTTKQLIEGIQSLVDPEIRESATLAKIQAAIQERKREIISALGVNVFEGITPETQTIRNQIAQYIFITHARKENILTACPETQAALDRVEELKRRYTPEKIAKMRALRFEIESLLEKINSIANDQMLTKEVLGLHGITQYRGKKIDGNSLKFIKDPANGWVRLLPALFKAEARKLDKPLIDSIREVIRGEPENDPLMTEDQKTEMVAAGLLTDDNIQIEKAIGYIRTRHLSRVRMQIINNSK